MNRQALQAVLDDAVAAGDVAGVVAVVTDARQTLVYGSAGVTSVGGSLSLDTQTLFWLASMTKPVTSLAAMQLVERGALALEMDMGALLPEMKNPMVLEDGRLRPATRSITLRHLLTHTSGYSYPFLSKPFMEFIAAQDPATLPMPNTRAALAAPLMFEPGERWEYGLSTDWLGLAVEAASGERLDAYFQRHIFAPLGMADTGFTPRAALRARQAELHQRQADGRLQPMGPFKPFAEHFCSGGAGLFSTLEDYQKFLRVFLNAGAGIIAPQTLVEMTCNQIGPLRAGHLPSTDPAMIAAMDVNPGQENKWGLGFIIYPQTGPFGRSAGSYGWSGLANTYFWVDPVVNIAAVILMQTLPAGDIGAMKTYESFERAVYAAPQ